MVARLIEGWESSTAVADYAGKWTAIAGANLSLSSAAGRYGNGLRHSTSGVGSFQRTFDAQATWVVGFALRLSAIPTATVTLLSLLDGATVHCGLGIATGTGAVFAWRSVNTTVLGTGLALPTGVWTYVEAKLTVNDTTGSVTVRFNGAPALTLTSQDTRNAGNASADVVRFGHATGNTINTVLDYDDLYVFDTTGGVNADFAGDCKVEALRPTGAGATTAWTPSAGSNYQCVDDADANEDTDYVASSTAAQTDTYAFGDLAVATSGVVKAVQATAQARKDDAGLRSLALVARPGSTDRLGATQSVPDAYVVLPQVWDTNPDTAAAWTVGEVNSSQFGIRLIA